MGLAGCQLRVLTLDLHLDIFVCIRHICKYLITSDIVMMLMIFYLTVFVFCGWIVFGKNKHEIISTCEDRKYPATFLALMALPFSKAVSGLYVALYWRSHVVSFGTQGLCIWLTRIPYCFNGVTRQMELAPHSAFSVSLCPPGVTDMVAMERAMSIRYSFRLQTSVWPWSSSGGCPYAYHNIAWISKHDK
ncbi:uncharacterized protein LOC103980986 isoform X1 [Musa acuminata AAA Group]|uniref:uncharacterized protein LOC103980986 isoform X1 n=1 Tax=Musa acuminata AAA Group TaxID=214697 RepID=UPI0031D0C260